MKLLAPAKSAPVLRRSRRRIVPPWAGEMCERIAAILQVKEGFRRLHEGWGKVMKALAKPIMAREARTYPRGRFSGA
jgi:hypothetical protein